jgi:hypothetical protein
MDAQHFSVLQKRCKICRRLLSDPADPIRSRDCGGDCLQCMADCGDLDCIMEMSKIEPKRYRSDEE